MPHELLLRLACEMFDQIQNVRWDHTSSLPGYVFTDIQELSWLFWIIPLLLPESSCSNFAETKELAFFILDQNVSLSKMTTTCTATRGLVPGSYLLHKMIKN